MEITMKSISKLLVPAAGALAILIGAMPSRAQDPAQTDPAHFKVAMENDRVRVLHVTVAPNTKVQLHEIDDAVVIPLVDYTSTLKTPDGKSKTLQRETGKPGWVPAGAREFEAGDKGVDALLIELKPASAK
jgi:hypothetical protein